MMNRNQSQLNHQIAVMITYSDHMGLKALKPACNKFFGSDVEAQEIVGQSFGPLTIALDEYRTKPGEIAIAMYKNADLAQCMIKNGLIKMTKEKVKQGYGEFSIAKICFQQMFYHDIVTQ